jgi:hypothetical protein
LAFLLILGLDFNPSDWWNDMNLGDWTGRPDCILATEGDELPGLVLAMVYNAELEIIGRVKLNLK